MYTTCPLICWCSSMFSLLWCKILLHYNEYSPFRRSNFYHTWNISYRTISAPSFWVKIGTCLGLNSLLLTVKTHQPCFRLFARGVFLSVISSASLPFFYRHPAILDFCGGFRWHDNSFPGFRSPLPVSRFSNIHWISSWFSISTNLFSITLCDSFLTLFGWFVPKLSSAGWMSSATVELAAPSSSSESGSGICSGDWTPKSSSLWSMASGDQFCLRAA